MRVDERLACSLILFFRNIYTSHKPVYLSAQLSLASDSHSYGTRQAMRGAFTQLKPKTDALKKTVMYRAITYWNRLPQNVISITSRAAFKNSLRREVLMKKIVFECV